MKPSCVLLLRPRDEVGKKALEHALCCMDVLAHIDSQEEGFDEEALAQLEPNVVLSFLNERILKGGLLECPNINFHPAPPEYPGRGGASRAMFDPHNEHYGATAHRMVRQLDAGPIYAVRRFLIAEGEGCDIVYAKGELAALELFRELTSAMARGEGLPQPDPELKWGDSAMSFKAFKRWMELDPGDPDAFARKVEACRHPKFTGPYLELHGYRFVLDSSVPPN